MWAIGAGWRTGAGARAWLLQPSSPWPACGMDCDLGAAVLVPGLRPHDESLARLAASVALVRGDSHHRSVIPAFNSARDSARDRGEVRTPRGCAGMAESAAVAGAVVGFSNIVGLAGTTTGHSAAGTDPIRRPTASEPTVGRDADSLGIGGEGSSRVGVAGEVEPERAYAQPAFSVARDAVPSGNRFRFRFWKTVNPIAHRERPWARAPALAMLGSIT